MAGAIGKTQCISIPTRKKHTKRRMRPQSLTKEVKDSIKANAYNVASISRELEEGEALIIQDSQKANLEHESAVRKANGMPAFISMGLEYKSKDGIPRPCKALVRPCLEYCQQF